MAVRAARRLNFQSRDSAAGYALALLLCFGIAAAFLDGASARVCLAIAGLSSWLAAAVLWSSLAPGLKAMAAALVLAGVVAGAAAGTDPLALVARALSQNVGILCMLMAVGFLRLVSVGRPDDRPSTGLTGWWKTLFATALFGSVINITAMLLIAEYIRARGGGNAFSLQALTRVFTASAAWSPFFAGMAVVLAYVPGASVLPLMGAALPFAVLAMLLTCAHGRLFKQAELADFVGFPLQVQALALPTVLATMVVIAFVLMPGFSVVITIALSSLLTCLGFLIWRRGGRSAASVVREHVECGLASGRSELVLFLAAGVLAVGLGALFNSGLWSVPDLHYDWKTASMTLAMMIGLAVLGIHPIVSVAGLAPVLLTLSPPPQLLALSFLFAWSLGTSVGPMSATLLTVQGRYGLASWRVALANAPFACAMWCVAVCCLYVVDTVFLEHA